METKKEMFEIDYATIVNNRKTLKDHIKASNEVSGDIVSSTEDRPKFKIKDANGY